MPPGHSGRCSPNARVYIGQDEKPVVCLDGPSPREPLRKGPERARSREFPGRWRRHERPFVCLEGTTLLSPWGSDMGGSWKKCSPGSAESPQGTQEGAGPAPEPASAKTTSQLSARMACVPGNPRGRGLSGHGAGIPQEGDVIMKGLSSAWMGPPCSLPGGRTWAGPGRSVAPGLPHAPGALRKRARSRDPQEGGVIMKGLSSAWAGPPCSLPGGRTWAGPGRSVAPGLPHSPGVLSKVQPQRQSLQQTRREPVVCLDILSAAPAPEPASDKTRARSLPGCPESPGVTEEGCLSGHGAGIPQEGGVIMKACHLPGRDHLALYLGVGRGRALEEVLPRFCLIPPGRSGR
uniref:Uncharacterized protein n=1 Tax=Myotis myotis TaxID=51298 RepID=A0A7J7R3P3_MYOMY|nr:hypothetical protein mMyoMyo1_010920 [Myotis myotis]